MTSPRVEAARWEIPGIATPLALKNREEYRVCIGRMNLGARYEMRQHPLARHPVYNHVCI